jgi:hypothetical protein
MAMSFERQFAFIDESGSPFFDSNRPEEGYAVVSMLITQRDLAAARLLIPRGTDGQLLKSSGQNETDDLAARFITSLFKEMERMKTNGGAFQRSAPTAC